MSEPSLQHSGMHPLQPISEVFFPSLRQCPNSQRPPHRGHVGVAIPFFSVQTSDCREIPCSLRKASTCVRVSKPRSRRSCAAVRARDRYASSARLSSAPRGRSFHLDSSPSAMSSGSSIIIRIVARPSCQLSQEQLSTATRTGAPALAHAQRLGTLRYLVVARRRVPALRRAHAIVLPSEENGFRARQTFAAPGRPSDGRNPRILQNALP